MGLISTSYSSSSVSEEDRAVPRGGGGGVRGGKEGVQPGKSGKGGPDLG